MKARLMWKFVDGKNWLFGRCHRIGGSRRAARLLLPRSGSQGPGIQLDFPAFQDQAHLRTSVERQVMRNGGREIYPTHASLRL